MTRSLRLLLGVAAACLTAAAAHALTVIPPSFPELVAEADTIVLGTVKEVSTRKLVNASGREVIKTFVRFRVEDALKGRTGPEFELALLGGKVGADALIIPGMPEFTVGATEMLFVARNGRVLCPLIGASHGAYPVSYDTATGERRVFRRDGRPLSSLAEIGRPLAEPAAGPRAQSLQARGLRLDDFRRSIVDALATSTPVAR